MGERHSSLLFPTDFFFFLRKKCPTTPTLLRRSGSLAMLLKLFKALTQCVTIILIGCLSRRLALFSPSEAAGISAFVGRLAMPGLLFLAMAELEIDSEAWRLVAAISAAKGLVFAITAGLCLSALCRRTSDSVPFAERKATWLGRAGLYAIATTQSNDFALGLPLCAAIWGGRFDSTIYLAAPVQLALLNPLGFALLEAGAEAGVEAAEARLLPSGGGGGATSSRRQLARVCSKVLRSPLVFSVVVGSAVRAALQSGGHAALPELWRVCSSPSSRPSPRRPWSRSASPSAPRSSPWRRSLSAPPASSAARRETAAMRETA